MNTQGDFLGRGWSFPPAFDKAAGTVSMVRDEDDIQQSLQILLSTSVGERVMQPLYGCNLRDYQFEPANNTFAGFLTDLISRAILFYEPRIVVQNIDITGQDDPQLLQGLVQIEVEYVIAQTNTRNNFVYPFYLLEATSSA